jgi:hypothetical protein
MSDPEDIVGKADAFLGRYRPGPQDLPVLTDVVDAPGAAPDASGEATRPPDIETGLSEAELRGIERQITQRVLDAIQPALSGLLEQALGTLAEQCKAQIDAIVRDAVTKTVEREVQQLRQPRPPGR